MSTCRFCAAPLRHTFVDLGMSPISNAFIAPERQHEMEPFYPLHALVCEQCLLVQLEAFERAENIFNDQYVYFSSYSDSWLAHARRYVDMAVERFGLGAHSQVIELASNDGYLLQYFVERGVPVLGVEPCANVAAVAQQKQVPTLVQFFGVETARELAAAGTQADLLLGNNVLAHVPDLNDFVGGMKIVLAPQGVITIEFPHLLRLMIENQFDTIYQEHYSYFSFGVAQRVFARHELTIFDVEELPTHGGSLRIYARHAEDASQPVTERVGAMLARESQAGLDRLEGYRSFTKQVAETKRQLLSFLIEVKRAGKQIVGYGAPAKGNTLLNYCGIRSDFLDYTVDRSPHKQGLLLPGTRIPVFHPDRIRATRPDYVLILPWNIKHEVVEQMSFIREWGGQLVVPIPQVEVIV